jgi:hypothetical protein
MPCTAKYGGLNGMAEIVGEACFHRRDQRAHSPKGGPPLQQAKIQIHDEEKKKKENLPRAVWENSNFARYAFKGFRFAPIPFGGRLRRP